MEKIHTLSIILFSTFIFSSCGGGGGSSSSSSTNSSYSFNCNNEPAYDYSTKFTYTSNHTATTKLGTVVFAHGKSGFPNTLTYYATFFNDLNSAGYDVKSITMPWSSSSWDGTSCQSLNLMQAKATEFKTSNEKLILIGHSLGGSHVQILSALSSTIDIDGVVALAPGHMPSLLTGFQNKVASEVSRANAAVAANNGNVVDTYITPNGSVNENISLTPSQYLSYHDHTVFADHSQLYPQNILPILWVGGNSDSLVSTYSYSTYFNKTANPSNKNQYTLVNGNHLGMIANSGSTVTAWIAGL